MHRDTNGRNNNRNSGDDYYHPIPFYQWEIEQQSYKGFRIAHENGRNVNIHPRESARNGNVHRYDKDSLLFKDKDAVLQHADELIQLASFHLHRSKRLYDSILVARRNNDKSATIDKVFEAMLALDAANGCANAYMDFYEKLTNVYDKNMDSNKDLV
jgi:hypothetical protein